MHTPENSTCSCFLLYTPPTLLWKLHSSYFETGPKTMPYTSVETVLVLPGFMKMPMTKEEANAPAVQTMVISALGLGF